MDKIDQIYDFIGGNLSKENEDILFSEMASDKLLRAEFKSMLTIKSTLHDTDFTVSSPPESKEALFAGLGLAAGNSGSAFSTSKTVIGTAIVILLFMGSFLSGYYFNSSKQTKNQEIVNNIANINLDLLDELKLNDNKSSNTKDKLFEKDSKLVQYSHNQISREDNTSYKLVNSINLSKANDASYPRGNIKHSHNLNTLNKLNNVASNIKINRSLIDFSNNSLSSIMNKTNNNSQSFDALNNTNEFKSYRKRDFRVSISGANYWHNIIPEISPSNYQDFNNTNIGIFYSVNKFEVGAKLTRENFSLRYNTFVDGDDFIYSQQPNYSTFSLAINYMAFRYGITNNYIGIEAGANRTGAVARANFGTQIEISNGFGFDLGIGISRMFFQRDDNNFTSDKYNLNYGIFYRF